MRTEDRGRRTEDGGPRTEDGRRTTNGVLVLRTRSPVPGRAEAPMTDDPIDSLRDLCMALPEVTERLSHGEPTWFVRDKKVFVMLANHHHDERLAFWCAAPEGAQEMLAESDPDRYFRPPYVGHRGWLGVYLDVPVDRDEIEELVTDAYCLIAPTKLADQAREASDES